MFSAILCGRCWINLKTTAGFLRNWNSAPAI
ncbi:MAG: hypothetical protein ACKO57_01610 [Alphaproteobacteria bacterium]